MTVTNSDGRRPVRRSLSRAVLAIAIALAAVPLGASVVLPAAVADDGALDVERPDVTGVPVDVEDATDHGHGGTVAAGGDDEDRALPPGVTNVTVTPDGSGRGVWLEFDSALLGLRAVNHVRLPVDYDPSGAAHGTLYRLHGTRGDAGSLVGPPPTPPLGASARASGAVTNANAASAPTEDFLVVALDEGAGWCDRCWWVDGRDGHGVLAESHFLREVIPVVEATFNVRTDRGGRAVYGTSMGGIGALIQAFRHPDLFAYVGSQSGSPSQSEHDDEGQVHQDNLYYASYLRFQGYPDPVTNPIAYRNIDVVTLAPQVIGTDLEIVLWAGDGCVPPYDPEPQPIGDPDCLRTSSLQPMDGFHMINERGIRNQNEVFADRLVDLGVPFRLETGHGRHGVSTMYTDHIIPDLNRLFAGPGPVPPRVFSYKTTDRAFAVWGYDVDVQDRPNEELLSLLGAQHDGRVFTLAGTGRVRVRTPVLARPGSSVQVVVIRENAEPVTSTAAAGSDCRITLELDLGQTRDLDQRRDLSREGTFAMPRTRVELTPVTGLPGPPEAPPTCL